MKDALRTSLLMLIVLTVLTGVVYPLVVTAVAQAVLPSQASGSLVLRDGKPVGSSLVGQPFSRPGYFWGRPSATSPTPYNAAASGGSNLGPLNPTLESNVESRIESLREADPSIEDVPVDLVTASGSGLDPHISPAAAAAQARRVARARGKSEDEVRRLVALHTEGRQLGLLGGPRVNVLLLNLALDHHETAAATAWKIPLPTHHATPAPRENLLRTHLSWQDITNPDRLTPKAKQSPTSQAGGRPR